MTYDDRLGDYNDVASRMREFFERYPDGRLRPAAPWRFETVGDKAFVVYEAAAYRTHDDPLPGIGTAWEPFPGRTPYTRDSELMNAETSAWGRAILAVGAADTRRGIASREEVRNRQADREHRENDRREPEQARQALLAKARKAIAEATEQDALDAIGRRLSEYEQVGRIAGQEAVELRRLLVARIDELFPAGEQAAIEEQPVEDRTAEPSGAEPSGQQPMDAEWPEPAKPGGGSEP